jgi:hypothetical protein
MVTPFGDVLIRLKDDPIDVVPFEQAGLVGRQVAELPFADGSRLVIRAPPPGT